MIIIEDRLKRQKDYLISFEIMNYYDVVDNRVGDRFTELKTSFEKKINIDEELSSYDVVAVHRSAFDGPTLDNISTFLKKTSKKLVLFSGGISSSSLVGNVLNINSKDFYSQNLRFFFEMLRTSDYHLSALQFGIRWRLSLLLSFREKLINSYNSSNDLKNSFTLADLDYFDQISPMLEFDLDARVNLELAAFNEFMKILNQEISSFLN